jgi:hypothetical protein
MADPPAQTTETITPGKYYRVEVTGMFNYAGNHYEPGTVYHVPEALYNGSLPDGKAFKDLCVTAQAVDSY